MSSILGLVLALGVSASSQAATLKLDVVQSVPLETNLALPNVQDTQASWIEYINTAQSTIDLEEFYFQSGPALVPVVDALKAAAARGVKIRMLLDSKFYVNMPNDAIAFAQVPNVQIKTVDFSSTGGIMHAKYFIVDNQKSYVGSANFDYLALSHIHEVGLKIDDSAIASTLESIFAQDWGNGIVPHNKKGGHGIIGSAVTAFLEVFASPTVELPSGVSPTLSKVVDMMKNATHTIKIQVYEYATKSYGSTTRFADLDDAIRGAAARGVKVQLLVDKAALSAGKDDLKALARLPNIEVRIVTIPAWSGGPLQYARLVHSKYMIIDDKESWVGSENWQGGYFTGTRNVGLVTDDATCVQKTVQIFSTVWNSGYTSAP